MNSFFMIRRASDGKTDNIYEFDFKNGKFIGGADNYTYDDISHFMGVPSEILKTICVKPAKKVVREPVVLRDGNEERFEME